jgi:hypothetical protein
MMAKGTLSLLHTPNIEQIHFPLEKVLSMETIRNTGNIILLPAFECLRKYPHDNLNALQIKWSVVSDFIEKKNIN